MLSALMRACNKAFSGHQGEKTTPPRMACLTFTVSGTLFGIHMSCIREIVPCGVFAVPRDKPGFIRGLFRHEGTMIPVIDLAQRYSFRPTEIGGRSCLVIVEIDGGKRPLPVGIVADEVGELAEFMHEDLMPLSAVAVRTLNVDIVQGTVRWARNLLVVLDLWTLLSEKESWALGEYVISTYSRDRA